MDSTIQTNLCKGLRACGIPKEKCHQILNEVIKWYDSSGPEWTNARIKDLRQWYETCLTGKPVPPDWFRHNKEGYPCGIWKWVFDQKPGKALGCLSMNTVFYEDHLSEAQLKKFEKGLSGNQSYSSMEDIKTEFSSSHYRRMVEKFSRDFVKRKEMPEIHFPTLFDMTGSIPVHEGHSTVHPDNKLGKALKALQLSWESVPKVTFNFLDRMDYLGYMPEGVLFTPGGGLRIDTACDERIGRVSVLQQPQLKARVVGNPNRVLQATLEPLKEVYMTTARKLPTDVTFDQESGVRWVQKELKQGHELAGSDLTSASDLLEITRCLTLVDGIFGFPKIAGYREYEEYLLEVSRSKWFCKELNRDVKWEQGSVLGTGPSFGLLTLTNNCCAMLAWCDAIHYGDLAGKGSRLLDSFRVVGDDIVMRSEMLPYYNRWIERIGGEINHSKTLVSDRVAEFAGRIITSDCHYLKAIKYSEPSDNSFMEYMSQLGDQAKYFLLPKQRQVYELFKQVPGIAVPGPWMQDSYGVSLSARYQWYLQEVEPVLKTAEPDLRLEDYEMTLLKAQLSLAAAGETDKAGFDSPVMPEEGYLPSQVTPTFKVGGDPRLAQGKSTLDVLYEHVKAKDITPFEEWIHSQSSFIGNDMEDFDDEDLPDEPLQGHHSLSR